MHSDIKAFWSKGGNTVMGGSPPMYLWSVYIDLGMSMYRIETICHGDKYCYNKEWYSEEQMLRIIKQKAFL